LQSSVLFVAYLNGKPIARSIRQFRIDRVNAQPFGRQRLNHRAAIHLDGDGYLLAVQLYWRS
jgi:hypothetical protein